MGVWILAVAAMLIVPGAGAAAPPGNDDFEDRQVLSGTLPIAEAGTNLEATREPEEPVLDYGTDGHSVWYEWEATVSGFVTVAACDGSINTVLGVYTGGTVDALTEIAGGFASWGPGCFDAEAVTFEAVSGTTYEIVVDGVDFFMGRGAEGPFNLEIAETPVPANDDFANAETLTGGMFSESVYNASAEGFNWNATKEPGEPSHAGDPGGASVWYVWEAPFAGAFTAQACGRFERSTVAVYTGASVADLAQVAADDHSCSRAMFTAEPGMTYYIAVDGKFDGVSGGPLMGAISLGLVWERPPPPAEPEDEAPMVAEPGREAPPGVVLPDAETTLTKKIIRPRPRLAAFYFGSTAPSASFLCALDNHNPTPCSSPRAYRHLKPGRHVFRVASTGAGMNWDPSSAVVAFRIPKPKSRS